MTSSAMTEPRTITNGGGESLTFLGVHEDERGPYVHVRNAVQPGEARRCTSITARTSR